MGALTGRRPKCLLPLAGETVLGRQLRLLGEVGVRDVAVVVGYRGADIVESVHGYEGITVAQNHFYRGNGPISSLVAARDYLTGDVLILNGDIAYDRQMLQSLLLAEGSLALTVSRTRARSSNLPLKLDGRRIVDLGRHIPTGECDAVFCGAGLVRKTELTRFTRVLELCAASSLATGWSFVFGRMASGGVEVSAVNYEGPWWNINSVSAYAAARAWARAESGSRERLEL